MFDPKTLKPDLKSLGLVLMTSSLILTGCSDTPEPVMPPPVVDIPPPPPVMAKFEVTISNLTNAQPFSPVAVITHQSDYTVFEVGSPATLGVELMAEGGDNSGLLDEASSNINVQMAVSGTGPIPPAGAETLSFELLESELSGLLLSTTTMLVNTNDAITGLNRLSLQSMVAGDVITLRSIAYDAGTESNSERAVHIPGPAGGGEGFNPARDDIVSVVTMHPGVVSSDDGLAISDLTDQHRFDNPVFQLRVERTE